MASVAKVLLWRCRILIKGERMGCPLGFMVMAIDQWWLGRDFEWSYARIPWYTHNSIPAAKITTKSRSVNLSSPPDVNRTTND